MKKHVTLATKNTKTSGGIDLTVDVTFFGDHMYVETPVPIPNTVVKRVQPMIVEASAKVGIAKFYKPRSGEIPSGVFYCASLAIYPRRKLQYSTTPLTGSTIVAALNYRGELSKVP